MKKQGLFHRFSAAFLVIIMALSMSACSTSDPQLNSSSKPEQTSSAAMSAPALKNSEASGKTEEKKYSVDELNIGICKGTKPRSLASESGSFGRMNYNGFCAGTWMVRDENNVIQPNLMTSWEIRDNGDTIRAKFATDKGITWHDGEPFTIDDIIFTVDFMNNKLKSGYLSKITSTDKVDDTTVDFHLKDKAGYFTIGNSAVFVRTYPKHIWENIDNPNDYDGKDATVGCGPYKLVSVDEDAQILHFEAVADWPLGNLAVKKVNVRSYDSQDALVMALTTGEVDAMYDYSNPISPTMLSAISNVKNLNPGKGMNMGLFEILYGFKKSPTNDLSFREAVQNSLNYELLATTIGGEDGKIPGEGIISPAGTAYDSTLPQLKQDAEKAGAILDNAGYKDLDGDGYREMPDGSKMDVLVTPQNNQTKSALYGRIAEIVIQNLNAVGVKCTLDEESVSNADHETQVHKNGTYQIYICYATQGVSFYKTPFLYMFNNPLSMWGTCDLEDFDAAYNNMLNAQGPDDYADCVKKLQQINAKDIVGTALCWDTAYYPYRTDKYDGWTNIPGWGVINYKTWNQLKPKS